MKRHFVVEGSTDELILRWLLEGVDEGSQAEIVVARGRNAAPPIARSLLVKTGRPVALVVDADQREDLPTLKSYFSVLGPDAPFALLVARPTIEGVLLSSEEIVQTLAGRKPSDEERLLARYDPKKALQSLLGEATLKDALGKLGPKERELALKQEFGLRLQEFFERLREIGPLPDYPNVQILVRRDQSDPAAFELLVIKPDHQRSIRMTREIADMLRGATPIDEWLLTLAENEAKLERPPAQEAPFVHPAGEPPPTIRPGSPPVAPAGEPPPAM